jgi:hypothetical protein
MNKAGPPSYYRILEEKAHNRNSAQNEPRFVKFSYFKLLKEFPRYPDHQNYTVPLSAIGEEAREKSLFLYVSYRWLRSSMETSLQGEWEGKPHPDNKRNDVMKLCVKGIEQIIKLMAPSSIETYLWIDYCCLNQDHRTEPQMLSLPKVMELCDAVFVPIHDPDYDTWDYRMSSYSSEPDITMYQSSEWINNQNAPTCCYLNRAWCRLELFNAAAMGFKLLYNKRINHFKSELLYHLRKHQRPTFLYGTKEFVDMNPPLTLPPISPHYWNEFHPEQGFVTDPEDDEIVVALTEQLQPLIEEKLQMSESKENATHMEMDWKEQQNNHHHHQSHKNDDDGDQLRRNDDFFNKFFQRRPSPDLMEADDDDHNHNNLPRVYSDEFLFESGGSGREGRDMNETMFNKGIYAGSRD